MEYIVFSIEIRELFSKTYSHQFCRENNLLPDVSLGLIHRVKGGVVGLRPIPRKESWTP
jgi:hypothetical protein